MGDETNYRKEPNDMLSNLLVFVDGQKLRCHITERESDKSSADVVRISRNNERVVAEVEYRGSTIRIEYVDDIVIGFPDRPIEHLSRKIAQAAYDALDNGREMIEVSMFNDFWEFLEYVYGSKVALSYVSSFGMIHDGNIIRFALYRTGNFMEGNDIMFVKNKERGESEVYATFGGGNSIVIAGWSREHIKYKGFAKSLAEVANIMSVSGGIDAMDIMGAIVARYGNIVRRKFDKHSAVPDGIRSIEVYYFGETHRGIDEPLGFFVENDGVFDVYALYPLRIYGKTHLFLVKSRTDKEYETAEKYSKMVMWLREHATSLYMSHIAEGGKADLSIPN